MRSQKLTFLTGIAILAILAACAPGNTVPPTSAPTSAPATPSNSAPSTLPPAATPAASAAVPPTSSPVIATGVVAPSATSAPASNPTTVAPSGTSTPVAGAIAHLQAGQTITITSIRMLDATIGWATGGRGSTGDHVLTTADGGQTWRDVTPPQATPSSDQGQPNAATITVGNTSTVWVIYGSFLTAAPATATFWRTMDGGQTWTASQPIDLSTIGAAEFFQPSDIRFLPDIQTGWFVAHLGVGMNHDYFTIMKTADGGQTWTRLIDPSTGGPQSCPKTGLHFSGAQNGWLTGDCQGVAPGVFFMHSTDGGATWTNAALPAPASQPDIFTRQDAGCGTYAMRFFDPQNAKLAVSCLIIGANVITSTHFIYTTADGGQNWTSNPAPARNLTFINPQIGWALPTGEANTQPPFALSQTLDGGKTWTTVKQLAWTGQLSFVDPQDGWAVAQADQAMSLVKTTDGGHTWQAVNAKIAP